MLKSKEIKYCMRCFVTVAYLVIATCFIFQNVFVEVCDLGIDTASMLHGLSITLALLGWPVLIYTTKYSISNGRIIRGFSLGIVAIVLLASAEFRLSLAEVAYLEFNGEVIKKYRSKNRGARSLVIGEEVVEFFPTKLWEFAAVGDEMSKSACVNIVSVNGIDFRYSIRFD